MLQGPVPGRIVVQVHPVAAPARRAATAAAASHQFDLVFMLIRDPVQRMVSEYRHAREMWRPEALLSFSAWLCICLRLARMDPAFRNNHFRAQADYHVEGAKVLHYEDDMLPCLNERPSRHRAILS